MNIAGNPRARGVSHFMGALRLLLALVVVIAHSGALFGFAPLSGVLAVQTFFMISGFYMAMILNEKYRGPGSYRLFITNRFLRIYPTYWAILLFAVVVNIILYLVIGVGPLEAPQKTGITGLALLSFSNLFIFGQDAVMYFGTLPKGPIFFTSNIHNLTPQLWTFLFIPPAWSLSLELMFYVIAPLILRRPTKVLIALIVLSTGLRAFLFFKIHLTNDPWTNRFFPTEIAFFLAGAIAYRIYLRVQAAHFLETWWPTITAIFFACLIAYQFLPSDALFGLPLKQGAYYLIAWAAIPFIFVFSKTSKLDRFIGELSFPVYLIHYPMLKLLLIALHHWRVDALLAPVEIAATLVAALAVTKLLTTPLETIRQRRIVTPTDRPIRVSCVSRYNTDSGSEVAGTITPQSAPSRDAG
jgi:peptidoglycan/LPS O-acetylase OafA/YrhL